MARPRQSENAITARERIEEAFWSLLASNNYSKISIKMLAAEANVNHNSIYYHYENIDEVAKSAFNNVIIQDLKPIMAVDIKELWQVFLTAQSDYRFRFERIRLFASSGSDYLQSLLKNGLIDVWLSQTGKCLEDLSLKNQMELDFIFSGIVAMLGRDDEELSKEVWDELLNGELLQTIFREMQHIVLK